MEDYSSGRNDGQKKAMIKNTINSRHSGLDPLSFKMRTMPYGRLQLGAVMTDKRKQ